MIENKKKIAALLLVSLFSLNSVMAGTNFNFEQPAGQLMNASGGYNQPVNYDFSTPLRGSVVQVPAGSTFNAALSTPISSASAMVGDVVQMYLSKDFYYNGNLIAKSGSTISGNVVEVSKAKHGSINGKICVRFNQIITSSGNHIPLSAVIKTNDGSGVLVGGTKMDSVKEYTKDLAVGSAAGALSGVVFGALAGGSVGRGAALGTAVGAGGGLVKSVADKGNDVEIPANSSLNLVLTQPLVTSVSAN